MRIATLIMAVSVVLVMSANASFGLIASPEHDRLVIGVLCLLGAALALGVPLASFVAFAAAALIDLWVAGTTNSSTSAVWGMVSVGLALMSIAGMLERATRDARGAAPEAGWGDPADGAVDGGSLPRGDVAAERVEARAGADQ